MTGWNHYSANWTPKACGVCGGVFTPKSGVHKFCSTACKGKAKYMLGHTTTESQYKLITGNWERYSSRLLALGGRKKSGLSRKDILDILEKQQYLCALSGVPLTCTLQRGTKTPTNASIDRINAGGPYTKDNVQIVCAAVNSFRKDLTVEQYIDWCKKVTYHNMEIQNAQTKKF